METDIRYYRRRACEEMTAAARAVTPAARQRRLQLVGLYLDHLKALNAPSPFDEKQLDGMRDQSLSWSAFGWADAAATSERI